MKKILLALACLLLTGAMILAFTACGEDDETGSADSSAETTTDGSQAEEVQYGGTYYTDRDVACMVDGVRYHCLQLNGNKYALIGKETVTGAYEISDGRIVFLQGSDELLSGTVGEGKITVGGAVFSPGEEPELFYRYDKDDELQEDTFLLLFGDWYGLNVENEYTVWGTYVVEDGRIRLLYILEDEEDYMCRIAMKRLGDDAKLGLEVEAFAGSFADGRIDFQEMLGSELHEDFRFCRSAD